jgi:uncharacterized protein (TIGR02996 family)
MTDGEGFLDALRSRPADDAARGVYADWLEEQGDPASAAKAAYLRVECVLSEVGPGDARKAKRLVAKRQKLAASLDVSWLAVVSKPGLEDCGTRFRLECPKRWDRLHPTPEDRVRFCATCQRRVHYCDTIANANERAQRGECIAVGTQVERKPLDLAIPLKLGHIASIAQEIGPEELARIFGGTRGPGGDGQAPPPPRGTPRRPRR